MSVTDELLSNAQRYAQPFAEGDQPASLTGVAVVTCVKPTWAAEAFTDLHDDVRQNIGRIKADTSIPVKDSVRGSVYDVKDGSLREVN